MDNIWEDIHKRTKWGEYPPEFIIRFVARNYYRYDRNEIKILDFGCGQGANTWYLSREGFDTYAFDGSASAVKKCQEKLGKEGLSADLRVLDGAKVDYPDDYFDAIIDNACIYSNDISSIQQMYQNCFDLLKHGGRLLTACFGEDLGGYRTGKEIDLGRLLILKKVFLQTEE